jgi:hypothetical protein
MTSASLVLAALFPLREHAVHGVPPRENARQAPVAFGHQDGADATLAHALASFSHCGARLKHDGILVSDDIRHLSHDRAYLDRVRIER